MQRKKDLVRAVHNRREPQRLLLEKNGTWKLSEEILRISQEFPEKYSREILRNFLETLVWSFQEFLETKSQKYDRQKSLKLGSNSREFLGNFQESFTRNCSREIPRKFLKASHKNWRTWGNSSLLLPGLWFHKWK